MTSPAPQPTAVVQTTSVNQGCCTNNSSTEGIAKYAKIFYNLGITQIVLGVISFPLGITLVVYSPSIYGGDCAYWYCYDEYGDLATGVWCGMFVIAGIVMAMISTLLAAAQFGIELSASTYASGYAYEVYYWRVACGLHSTLTFVGFVELVVSICHWAYGLHVMCCYRGTTAAVGSTYAYVNSPLSSQVPDSQQAAYIQKSSGQIGANPQFVQQPTVFTTTVPQQVTSVQGQQAFLTQQPPPYQMTEVEKM